MKAFKWSSLACNAWQKVASTITLEVDFIDTVWMNAGTVSFYLLPPDSILSYNCRELVDIVQYVCPPLRK